MSGKIIRYKQLGWRSWNTIKVSEEEYEKKVQQLLDMGYIVEGYEEGGR